MSKIERATIFFCLCIIALLTWEAIAGNPFRAAMREAGRALVLVGYYLIGSAG